MIKHFDDSNIKIVEYSSRWKEALEAFRDMGISEGNESIIPQKLTFGQKDVKLWLMLVDGEIASMSAVEASWYTGDANLAARICRYHVLKKYRHSNAGFRMLPYQVEWAKEAGFKVIYWTHDINNKPLNSLYQRKRVMPGKAKFFEDAYYKKFVLNKNYLFKVSRKSDFLQFVYNFTFDENFVWTPKTNMVPYEHEGEGVNVEKALELSKTISYSIRQQ